MDQLDPNTILTIVMSVFGALGVMMLGICAWAIQRQISTTHQNTIQISILGERVRYLGETVDDLNKVFSKVVKLETDMNHAHQKLREIKKET